MDNIEEERKKKERETLTDLIKQTLGYNIQSK